MHHNRLTSFENFETQPSLRVMFISSAILLTMFKELYLEKNQISSMYGLKSQPKLIVSCHFEVWFYVYNNISLFQIQKLNMQGNPICKHPHFRIMCLMTIGK